MDVRAEREVTGNATLSFRHNEICGVRINVELHGGGMESDADVGVRGDIVKETIAVFEGVSCRRGLACSEGVEGGEEGATNPSRIIY